MVLSQGVTRQKKYVILFIQIITKRGTQVCLGTFWRFPQSKIYMKFHKKLSILVLFGTFLMLYACSNNSDKTQTEAAPAPVDVNAVNPAISNQMPTAPEPAQNAAGVWHYICSNGCAGGAGVAGNCTVCGSPLAHNAVYHGAAAPAPTGTNPAAPQPQDPPQNAAGVWHYTCGKGCAGGAGAAGNCATCGGPLAHNALYHQ